VKFLFREAPPTGYAVTSRYPGDFESVDEEEYKETVRLAETVVLWGEKIIQRR